MSRLAVPVLLTVLAAALGGVAGALTLALEDAPPRERDPRGAVVSTGAAEPSSASRAEGPKSPGAHPAIVLTASGGAPAAWSARLSSDDPDVRNAAALELLRQGPDAWVQARALRPTSPAGRDLQGRLTAALRKMALVRRGHDYAKLPAHARERLDLDEARAVVPERLLVAERLRVWRAELESVRKRIAVGTAVPAEAAMAELEVLHARRDDGELAADGHAQRARPLVAVVESWLADLASEPQVPPARVRRLREQLARLTP